MPLKYIRWKGRKIDLDEGLDEGLLSAFPEGFVRYLYSEEGIRRGRISDTPHVTEIVAPMRMTYLQWLCDYERLLDSFNFSIIGTGLHEVFNKMYNQERQVKALGLQGTMDCIQIDDNGKARIFDYKCVGSYVIEKAKTGSFNDDYVMQLNIYRVMVEEAYASVEVVYLGNIYFNRESGLSTKKIAYRDMINVFSAEVPMMDRDQVKSYIADRRSRLLVSCSMAKEDGNNWLKYMPPICKETWGGSRCKKWCDVASFCVQKGDNRYISETDAELGMF
jgi:hypothetical protein